jgi:diguanylate cyclase (GGDEF)-like protein
LKDRLGESQVVAEQLEVLAQTDALMGVLNRGQIESLIEQEMKRSRRYDLPLSLVAFELDDFKQPNGTFGHDARDGMLVKTARPAEPHLRTRDRFGR